MEALPQAAVGDYTDGLSMAMGIGIPPVFETYEDLQQKPPQKSPFFSVMLDARDRWLNHHRIAVDGSVLHRDAADPGVLHVYLLSYERHTLLAHVVIESLN